MLDHKGFDRWADGYDRSVGLSDAARSYPFAGYGKVLDRIFQTVTERENAVVLDVGFGTGVLAARLYENGCTVYGQDFSEGMIAMARERMPGATLVRGDLSSGLSPVLRQISYDFIVSTYALHHLDDPGKITLIRALLERLKPGGRLLIGDVAFRTRTDLDRCRKAAGDEWDEDEFYFVRDEMMPAFPLMGYEQISFCAGLITLPGDGCPTPDTWQTGA